MCIIIDCLAKQSDAIILSQIKTLLPNVKELYNNKTHIPISLLSHSRSNKRWNVSMVYLLEEHFFVLLVFLCVSSPFDEERGQIVMLVRKVERTGFKVEIP